jgi:hypothetical protein
MATCISIQTKPGLQLIVFIQVLFDYCLSDEVRDSLASVSGVNVVDFEYLIEYALDDRFVCHAYAVALHFRLDALEHVFAFEWQEGHVVVDEIVAHEGRVPRALVVRICSQAPFRTSEFSKPISNKLLTAVLEQIVFEQLPKYCQVEVLALATHVHGQLVDLTTGQIAAKHST